MARLQQFLIIAALALGLTCGNVRAQSSGPLPEWQNATGIVLRSLAGPIPEWQVTIGGGGGVLPAYEGSNSSRLVPAPTVDIRYRDIAFASSGEGIGVNLLRGPLYRAGVALAFDPGREHNAATRLSGTGNIDPAAEPKIFAEFAVIPVIVSAELRYRATSQQGFIGDIGLYMPVVGNETLQVFLGPSITLADDQYMNTYFGISPQHAEPHSIFSPYEAEGGAKNVNLGASALYHFDDHWFVDFDAGIERLLGSAANSPIVQTRYGLGAIAVLCYTF